MRAHYLQHVPFEGLGSIEAWLDARGARVTSTQLYAEGARFPDPAAVDLLVVMGGPMSVNDEAELPWLVAEKRFVAAVIAAGKPVLGVCLGAQMIASALGAAIYPNPEPEIGWFEIAPVPKAPVSPFAALFAEPIRVFHWHGETFDLPPGATLLAESEACRHQAFAIGDRVLGLQFHLETTPASARALVEHCGDELAPARFVQSADEILGDPEKFRRANQAMSLVLERLAAFAR